MLQSFAATTNPADGPERLKRLRDVLIGEGLDGFLVPRADAHQGEWVPARDERLAWLTGFSGSAGFCAALLEKAGVFIDGRYRVQVKNEVDLDAFTPVSWPETELASWLIEALPNGGKVGFDPWLHVKDQIEKLTDTLKNTGIILVKSANLIDRIWDNQPSAPAQAIYPHPLEFSGETSASKRQRIAQILKDRGQIATVLTMPVSIAWLLNIRGSDIERTPVALAFAVLYDDASLTLFTDTTEHDDELRRHLGPDVSFAANDAFGPALDQLKGKVGIDKTTAAIWISDRLSRAEVEVDYTCDPCALPIARKNPTEINGARQAHLRDAVAMAELLAWLDGLGASPDITEIDVVKKLESLRAATNMLIDISFDTICGSGPNGAITHYRVTNDSNRAIKTGELLLVDSGGQYRDGTTDITRTIAIGPATDIQRACFTRVLKGMIAISVARWPRGLAGRDLDPLARFSLWQAGLDFDHGTGHGVGSFLGVHEGPQRLSRQSHVPFEAGMILSNEPGYYREGEFGIRIENLVVVQEAGEIEGADARAMLEFETLTFTPIDRNLIDLDLLTTAERKWLNTYHAEILVKITQNCSPSAQDWLARACAPI